MYYLTNLHPSLIDECEQQAETGRGHAAHIEQGVTMGVNLEQGCLGDGETNSDTYREKK